MSFDRRDIRKSMDVYTFDNVYLGTVLRMTPGPIADAEPVPATAQQTSAVNGETLGPMPTLPIGNPAPLKQSARAAYATLRDAAEPLGRGTITVGKWWGLVGRHTIQISDVLTVSLERVVLKQRNNELK